MEKGVGIWWRYDNIDTNEWIKCYIKDIILLNNNNNNNNDKLANIVIETNKKEIHKLKNINIKLIENANDKNIMLANNYDMDLIDNLIRLPHCNEPGICHTLNERFKNNNIYTYTGEILLAVNPFKDIGIYSDELIKKYIQYNNKKIAGIINDNKKNKKNNLPPHIFNIADESYRRLSIHSYTNNNNKIKNQSILVSGESGAGKTETTKFVMKYLASLSQTNNNNVDVMQQVLSSNPILEAFGNARTIRNDNSSRFGKYVKMQFINNNKKNQNSLVGASIQTYLLEKVRLVYQGEDERNYHIFYQLIAGTTTAQKKKWLLPNTVKKFHYLNQSQCITRKDGVNDKEEFIKMQNAMTVMTFTEKEKENIFFLIAGLLHLGNLEFIQSYEDQKHNKLNNDNKTVIDTNNDSNSVQMIQDLFEMDQEGIESALCNRKIQAKDEWYTIQLTPEKSEESRDALAKYIYGKLFHYLVSRINQTIEYNNTDNNNTISFIGLLDIFGFEDLPQNSFEQLCINYANESLQQHFNLTILKLEQDIYEEENIQWSFINFPDNKKCIELIEGGGKKKLSNNMMVNIPGIFDILDEESIVPKGNDENFVRKLYRQHLPSSNNNINNNGNNDNNEKCYFDASNTDMANHFFIVKHYAGNVIYDSLGICEKNKDTLYSEINNLLKRSPNQFLRTLHKINDAKMDINEPNKPKSILKKFNTNSKKKNTLASQFRIQLKNLMNNINQTTCFYVRCLKPNDENKKDLFINNRICDQLRAGGVLEAVRVNRSGYPVRLEIKEFIKRYRSLADIVHLKKIPNFIAENNDMDNDTSEEKKNRYRQGAEILVQNLKELYKKNNPTDKDNNNNMQMGKTKIFFRREAIQFVEAQLTKRYGEFVILIQSIIRGYYCYKKYKFIKKSILLLQSLGRGYLVRIKLSDIRKKHFAKLKQLEYEKRLADGNINPQTYASNENDPSEDDDDDDDDDDNDEDDPRYSRRTSSRRRKGKKFRFTKKTMGVQFQEFHDNVNNNNNKPRSVAMTPGDTVLHLAANCCNADDVLTLLENGANVNATNHSGRTPLHTAALHHNLEIVSILLDWGADVCAQDVDNNTPLHIAKDPQICRILLDAGCNPNFINSKGKTVLIEACERSDLHVVKALLDYKADIFYKEKKHGQTALHIAVRKGYYDIVKILCNILINDKNNNNNVLLKKLLNQVDNNENNVLHFAVAKDRKITSRMVHYLVHNKANVNKKNIRQQTPLAVHIITTQKKNDSSIVKILLENNADCKLKLSDQSTLLHIAVERDLIDIACVLVNFGSSLTEPDNDGKMVIDLSNKKYLKRLLSAITYPPTWINDNIKKSCMLCQNPFKFGSRRHHCRHCGRICCSPCSSFTIELYKFPKEFPGRVTNGGKAVKDMQRICKTCNIIFKTRAAEKESKSGFMARVLGYEWDEMKATTTL